MTSESHAAMAAEIAELKAKLAMKEDTSSQLARECSRLEVLLEQRDQQLLSHAQNEHPHEYKELVAVLSREEKLKAKLAETEQAACDRIKANVMKQVDADIKTSRLMSAPATERADKLEAECAALREVLQCIVHKLGAVRMGDVLDGQPISTLATEAFNEGSEFLASNPAGAKAAEVLKAELAEADTPKDETPYERNERLGLCQECGKPGKHRIDNGLGAGTHCDPCWDELVANCRRRSW